MKANVLYNHLKNDNFIWFQQQLIAEKNCLVIINEFNTLIQQKYYGSTLLHICAQYDSIDIGRYLLTEFNDFHWLEKRDNDGKTPLHVSCTYGSIRMTKAFLHYSSTRHNDDGNKIIDQLKRGDWTPLMIAVAKENLQLIKLLLNFKANETIRDKNGWNILHLATRIGNLEMIKFILTLESFSQKTDNYVVEKNERNIMHIAAINGHIDVFEFLLKHLKQINRLELIKAKDSCGITPLIEAVRIDCVEIVDLILNEFNASDAECFLKYLDDCDRNIMHHASQTNSLKFIQYLRENYEKILIELINQSDKWQQTPIYLAICENLPVMTNSLIKFGSNLNHKDLNNQTPVEYCKKFKYELLQ